MKVITKKVFYCDHCKKHNLTKQSMQSHEEKCLYNPKRICKAAYCPGNQISQEHIDLLKDMSNGNPFDESRSVETEDIEKLRNDLLDGCPICALAVLCQTKVDYKKEGITFYWQYDFKPINDKLYEEYLAENRWY